MKKIITIALSTCVLGLSTLTAQEASPSRQGAYGAVQASPATVDKSHGPNPAAQATTSSPSKMPGKAVKATTPVTAQTRISAHPYRAPQGAEAAHSRPAPVRVQHTGPTPVLPPSGIEAAHQRPLPVRARHTGPTPAHPGTGLEHPAATK